jgi:hypothetical protein
METISDDFVTVFVDPTCPFAWITRQWLGEVSTAGPVQVRVDLMSLSAVNEGRELSGWYRDYNGRAWRPARVAAAILASEPSQTWTQFYSVFGRRRHVEGLRDDDKNLRLTLDELELPPSLIDAADDTGWDADLRRRTTLACEPLNGDGGTPVLHLDGRAYFGPVLSGIPRGEAAVDLWTAVRTLVGTTEFSEIKGARNENELRTA